jgi:hypothetical protein
MGTKPFSYRITVVVLPARADIKPAVNNYRVSQGSSRNTRVGALLLRAVFEKPGQEGNEWRNVEVKSSDDGIATARLYKDPKDNYVLKVEIRGRSQGRATIILTGEARLQNTWQQVIREINVVVTGNQTNDKEPPADDSETDVFLDGIQRRYETLKNTSERIGPDDRKWSLMLQEFEQFIALLDQELEKERRRPNPRRERLSQLAKLRDKASQDLRHLREKQTDPGSETHNDEISSLTGNWRGVFRGEETRGFRIEEINGRVKLWSPTRLLVFEGTRTGMIVEGKSIVRSGETDTGLSLSRQLRVRTGTSGLRLEVWGKRMNEKLQETGDYYPTGIFYIREAR